MSVSNVDVPLGRLPKIIPNTAKLLGEVIQSVSAPAPRLKVMKKQQTAPRWLWLLLSVGIFAYLGSIVLPMVHCHYSGKEAVAVVSDFTTRLEGGGGGLNDSPRRVHYYTLNFDGHRVQKRTSGKGSKKIGDRLPVIYFPDNPDSAVHGSRADGLWRTIVRSTNERNLAIASGLGLFFLFAAAKKAKPRLGLA